MSRLFSKADLRAFSSVVAFVLLLGTFPLINGVVLVSAPGHAEIAVNICAPTQVLICASSSTLARPSVNLPRFVLFFCGSFKAAPGVQAVKCNEPPDTPPPKQLV
jgi:hypothetical protein